VEQDATQLVEEQHRVLLGLLDELERQPSVTERILGGQLRARQELLHAVERAFVQQEAAKHRHLWPVVRRTLPDGGTVVHEALVQCREIEHQLVKLRWFGDRDGEVDDVVAALVDDIREHLAFEHELLVRLRRHPPEEDLGEVAVRMSSHAWARPTRPHPDLPASRPLAGLVGFPMALADHLLDVFAFRPTGS
jgi:hemerythrin HHE cation binding domain-containing protein